MALPMATRAAIRPSLLLLSRPKTTSAQQIATRHRDPTFEKLMSGIKHYQKVLSILDLILASPSHSFSLPYLSPQLSTRLRLNRGGPHFIRSFPHIFTLSYDPTTSQPLIRLSPAATQILRRESAAADADSSSAVDRLRRLLQISTCRSLPLRAVFRVWRELGLPDDFEDSVLTPNPNLFLLTPNPGEPNTHLLRLLNPNPDFTPAVESWRANESPELRFGFKQQFPPGMRLSKGFRAKVKEWQQLPYAGPYQPFEAGGKRRSKARMRGMEKRAVGIAHEFLSLTVEKMVEVEKFSQFRRWFGIELNVRDLFLDHPGIFYISTKGKGDMVFLREAYEKGRLVERNAIYDARREMLELVLMRRRGARSQFVVREEKGGGVEE